MPSEKILEQKKQIVSDLADTLSSSVAGVIVDYKGITVEDDTKLRKDLREAGVKYAVVKNTILKLAAEKAELSEIDDVLAIAAHRRTQHVDIAFTRIAHRFLGLVTRIDLLNHLRRKLKS